MDRLIARVSLVLAAGLATVAVACGSDDAAAGSAEKKAGAFDDLPGTVLDDGVSEKAAAAFAAAKGDEDAPCLVEPEPGTLYPKNWLAPRFTWTASKGSNLYEVRLTVENQKKDLVVYTKETTWTMPDKMWRGLRQSSADVPMEVTVRSATWEGGKLSDVSATNGGDLGIAPVEAPGTIVFWSIQGGPDEEGESLLKGFTVGEPGLTDVLRSKNLASGGKRRTCIGCHTSTPDGKYVSVAWEAGEDEPTGIDVARIEKGMKPGPAPEFMSPAASSSLQSGYPMFSAFSRAHWAPGNRLMLTNEGSDLIWVDLEAAAPNAAKGVLGHAGDDNLRRMGPTWSRDGQAIAYMSGTLGDNPFTLTGPSDIYVMPFAGKDGATASAPATPLAGASDASKAEYYPAFSPDDAFVAFNQIPDNGTLYNNPQSEIFVVSRDKGERFRLKANDPPSCHPKKSPGITNSWPKWAPEVQESGDQRFYFVVFSSQRHLETDRPQLYVAPVVVDRDGGMKTYPALYLRNQEAIADWKTWGNHTPAWDVFQIAPAVVN